MSSGGALAGLDTECSFPGPACPCDRCQHSGLCAKPCRVLTTFYAAGCWVTNGVTCCDCDCRDIDLVGWCGCSTDYHQNPAHCPSNS